MKRSQLRTDFLSAVSDCKLALQTKCAELDNPNGILISELQVEDTDLYTCEVIPLEDDKYLKFTFTHKNEKLNDQVTFLLASHCGAKFVDDRGATE